MEQSPASVHRWWAWGGEGEGGAEDTPGAGGALGKGEREEDPQSRELLGSAVDEEG